MQTKKKEDILKAYPALIKNETAATQSLIKGLQVVEK